MENVRRKSGPQEPTERLIRVAWKRGEHNGNGSKNERFFKVCRDYGNSVKVSTVVLLIKPMAF